MAGYDQHPSAKDAPITIAFDEEGLIEETHFDDEEGQLTKSLPWMAMALVAHAVMLLIAVFIVTAAYTRPEIPVSSIAKEAPDMTPEVEVEEDQEEEIEEKQEVVEDPTQVDKVESEVDAMSLSDAESPINSPNPNPDDADSPSPHSNANSNSGLGNGGGGGNGGPRGGGPRGIGVRGIQKKPSYDRTMAALQWLADHQNPAGYWSPNHYHRDSIRVRQWSAKVTRNIDTDSYVGKEDDIGRESFTTGVTGLALLAFVGDGHTHRQGAFRHNVKRAASYLMQAQGGEGCYGTKEEEDFVYNHAVVTMAFAELYAMTGTRTYKASAQAAVDYIIKLQNPGLGWRYGVQSGENDSSVTAWMVLALKSAKIANLKFNSDQAYAGAIAWYDEVYDVEESDALITSPRKVTGYNSPASGNSRPSNRVEWEQNPSMDACNAMVRLFTGDALPKSKIIRELGDTLLDDKPVWFVKDENGKPSAQKIDYYYWYYGSLAAFQMGGKYWKQWEESVMDTILKKYQRGFHPKDVEAFGKNITNGVQSEKISGKARTQIEGRSLLDEHGSWDGLDPWSEHGGRVYTTAINALTLEVYYRYLKIQPRSGKKTKK